MSEEYKTIAVFVVGTFLSALFYIDNMLNQASTEPKKHIAKIISLTLINSVIGGVVMVTSYYAMVQFAPDWHEYLKVGIAGTTSMLGKDAIHLYHKFITNKVNK